MELLAKLLGWLVPKRDDKRADFQVITDEWQEFAAEMKALLQETKEDARKQRLRLDELEDQLRQSKRDVHDCLDERDELRRRLSKLEAQMAEHIQGCE